MKGLISATTWVPRGIAAQHPTTYEVDEKEIERISRLAQINIEEARAELNEANDAEKEFEGIEGDVGGDEDVEEG